MVVGCDGLAGRGTWETGIAVPHASLVAPSGEGRRDRQFEDASAAAASCSSETQLSPREQKKKVGIGNSDSLCSSPEMGH